nr:MAG TPA: hypothetical protein [Caudoviricetes sp.]
MINSIKLYFYRLLLLHKNSPAPRRLLSMITTYNI